MKKPNDSKYNFLPSDNDFLRMFLPMIDDEEQRRLEEEDEEYWDFDEEEDPDEDFK